MSAAILGACISVIGAILILGLNQRNQIQLERRQARLERINSQLRDLYGPLHTLVETNEQIWERLREQGLPEKVRRRSENPPSLAESQQWRAWRNTAFMPNNRRMRDLIIGNAHLIMEQRLPSPLQTFCAHVTTLEVLIATEEGDAENRSSTLIKHPGSEYVKYVRESFTALKAEQYNLLLLTGPQR